MATAQFIFQGQHLPDENGNTGCQEAASGYLFVGFRSLRLVHPGDVFEVPDDHQQIGEDEDGNPLYDMSDADHYRVEGLQHLYEEVGATKESRLARRKPETPPETPAEATEEQPA